MRNATRPGSARRVIALIGGLLLGLGLPVAGGVLADGRARPLPAPGASWDWQLVPPVRPPSGIRVFDTDPDLTGPEQIAALGARGIWTICYVSVGTLEAWRSDAAAFPPEVIGRRYVGWEGERFLDIRRLELLLPLMRKRFERCRRMGFDAVEPDNIDLHENDTGFPIREADVLRYAIALADVAHALGLAIGQKNAPGLADRLAAQLDFAVVEECLHEGWCASMAGYPARGKPVFAAEYVAEGEGVTVARRRQGCRIAARLGLSLVFKRRDLDRWRIGCEGSSAGATGR